MKVQKQKQQQNHKQCININLTLVIICLIGQIVNNQYNNKIMIEKSTKNNKQRHFKTEVFQQSQCLPFQFGKPIVKLPIINKKSGALKFRYDNTIDKSLDSKEKSHSKANSFKQDSCLCLNVEELILRKYSNNSQLQLLTFEQLQLCTDISKKILPKIAAMGAPSRQNTDRSLNDQYHKRLNRIKSQKKIDSTSELGSYKMGAIIGRGNYSVVRLCQSNEGKRYAAKVYAKQKINNPQREQNLKQEISILKLMKHPNVISFKEYVETEQNHYLIMEVFDNISLLNFIKKQNLVEQKQENYTGLSSQPCTSRYKQKARLNEGLARVIMKKILQAFAYIHENGIAHRDIKLENILVASQNKEEVDIKVIDFGFSRRCLFQKQADLHLSEMKQNKRQFNRKNSKTLQESIFYDYCGTPSYMSPQINQKRGYLARPSDVWALGIMLFYMVTGSFPFKTITQKSDFNNSIFQQLNPNIKISPPLTMMLKKMLKNDPLSRPSVKQLLLKEQWLNCQF